MLQAFLNVLRIGELRNKLLFTLGMLVIYRIGFFIPLPGVDQTLLAEWASQQEGSAAGNLVAFMSIFTGGSFAQSTLFALGIMPYISAAIIFQLLATVVPSLQQLQKEGPAGRQKIQEYTRYAAVGLCMVQALFYLSTLLARHLVHIEFSQGGGAWLFWLCGVFGMTAGTIFLMWLGEQIDKYGIGNGASLIITAGIVSSMPVAIRKIVEGFSLSGGDATYGIDSVIFLAAAFVVVVAGAIVITQGQRRIPIQQAKHTRGRRVYGGQKSYLPLRVNHGGVMPIIFASALMMFPTMAFGWMAQTFQTVMFFDWMNQGFLFGKFLYVLCTIGLIYFFAYFWTSVQFQPKEMATNLRDHGSFIPGLRPGQRTAEYLETVMERITYVGAGFLAVIAVIPSVVAELFEVDYSVSAFLGGTGLLICVSVMLDFVQRIEAGLLMRNYPGFLSGSRRIRGARHS